MIVRFYGARGSHSMSPSAKRIEEINKSIWKLARESKATTWGAFKKELAQLPTSVSNVYSGNTTCVEVISEDAPMPIFLDLGSGLSAAAADPNSGLNTKEFESGKGQAAFFMTHTHWDHILGFPTLFRLYQQGHEFHIYGAHKDLEKRFQVLFRPNFFPVPFDVIKKRCHFHILQKNEQIPFGKLKVSTAPQSHPGVSYAYRFEEGDKSFVFATDTDLSDTFRSTFKKGKNIYSHADLIAVDSHFNHEDFVQRRDHGHPSVEMVVDLAVYEEAKHLLLTHHNPAYDDVKMDSFLNSAREYLHKKHGPNHPLKISIPLEGIDISVG